VTAFYLNQAAFEAKDRTLVRLISLATQKFIPDVSNDALVHCKSAGAKVSYFKAKSLEPV